MKIPKYILPIEVSKIEPTDDGRVVIYTYVDFVNVTHRDRSKTEWWVENDVIRYDENGKVDREKTYKSLSVCLWSRTYRNLSNKWDLWWDVNILNK